MRMSLLFSFLLLSSTALADQAYIQANAWAVNRLASMPGQSPHSRCLLQTSFSGTSSVQFIAEGQKIRGAIFVLTEPVFQEEGRTIDVSITLDKKAWEFPAFTLSKYAVAVEISDAYEADFREALAGAGLLILKSGFNNYNFAIQGARAQLEDALACTPPAPPKPIAPPEAPVVNAAVEKAPEILTPMPGEELPTPNEPAVAKVAPPVEAQPPVAVATAAATAATATTVVNHGGEKETAKQTSAYFVKQAGKDVPLADALPMILPPGYSYKFTQGASAGERITWPAGDDWLETLIVSLDDANLQLVSAGKTITILPKIKATQLAVVSTENNRASVIVKEPQSLPAKKATDPTKPPSPGMQTEADVFLNNLRLDEASLQAIAKGQTPGEVPMPPKPDNTETTVTTTTTTVDTKDQQPAVIGMDDAPKALVPEAKKDPSAPAVFSATKGETVNEVLTRWGAQADTDLDVNLQRDYFLSKDVTVQGDLDLAVEQVLRQFDDLPSKPRMDSGEGEGSETASADNAPTPIVPPAAPAAPSEQEKRLGLVSNWNAVQGTSLRAALSNWARQAQMTLVWQSTEDSTVPRNVTGTRKLEDALDTLLSQYDDAPGDKPNIQINRDPDTGQMAMLVDIQPFTVSDGDKPSSKSR